MGQSSSISRLIFCLTLFLLCAVFTQSASGATANDKARPRHSKLGVSGVGSYPRPFQLDPANLNRDAIAPAIATGYYIVEDADTGFVRYTRKDVDKDLSDTANPNVWKTIVSGAHQLPLQSWARNAEGCCFFRNPATSTKTFALGVDSTDNAFAGPIPIGFPFVYNGIRVDSFYISTNGLIALTNRRYYYDAAGNRIEKVVDGVRSGYDLESDDSRAHLGSSALVDPTPDDFGYRCVALGLPPDTTTIVQSSTQALDGIRRANNREGGSGERTIEKLANDPALLMPIWSDLQMSVYNPATRLIDNFSKVRYKRSDDSSRLIIWCQHVCPRGKWDVFRHGIKDSSIQYAADCRPGSLNFICFDVVVIIDRQDSSVKYFITNTKGSVTVAGRTFSADQILSTNASCAVRGHARERSNSTQSPFERAQKSYSTCTIRSTSVDSVGTAQCFTVSNSESLATDPSLVNRLITFKQWKNVVRAVGCEIATHPYNSLKPFDYSQVIPSSNSKSIEVLRGDNRLGSIVPMPVFQNCSSDMQSTRGVNYQTQNIRLRCVTRIVNTSSGEVVYEDSMLVGHIYADNRTWSQRGYRVASFQTNSANGFSYAQNSSPSTEQSGVAPYQYIQLRLKPFTPSAQSAKTVEHLCMMSWAQALDTNNAILNESWHFDDTLKQDLIVVSRLKEFSTNQKVIDERSTTRFEMRDGFARPASDQWIDRGVEVVDGMLNTNSYTQTRENVAALNDSSAHLNSPVYRLNRRSLDAEFEEARGGDELCSPPLDISTLKNPVLLFQYHRGHKRESYESRWSDSVLAGPEVLYSASTSTQKTTIQKADDELRVEFLQASSDNVSNILLNAVPVISAPNWNYHSRSNSNAIVTDNPALTLYGGGGKRIGFHEQNPDSALSRIEGMRIDQYDAGKDIQWKTVAIPIPKQWLQANAAQNFRFRFRVIASNDSWPRGPEDDDDDFYIRDIVVEGNREVGDVGIVRTYLTLPCKEYAPNQLTQVNPFVSIVNHSAKDLSSFRVKVQIVNLLDTALIDHPNYVFQNGDYGPDSLYIARVYSRSVTVPFLPSGFNIELPFPTCDIRSKLHSIKDTLYPKAICRVPGGDLNPLNDQMQRLVPFSIGSSSSYFSSTAQSQVSSLYDIKRSQYFSDGIDQFGDTLTGLARSGQIAVRYSLQDDSVAGFQAYFSSSNPGATPIVFSIYRDSAGVPESQPIPGSELNTWRGVDYSGFAHFDTLSLYTYKKPLRLAQGNYWFAVGLNSFTHLQLGATDDRGGTQKVESNWVNLNREFRRMNRAGKWINDWPVATELGFRTGKWTLTLGNGTQALYQVRDQRGTIGAEQSLTNGTLMPMLRPYFARGPEVPKNSVPVEIIDFSGEVRDYNVDLRWSTASEKSNDGFEVERRGENSDQFQSVCYIRSKAGATGTSAQVNHYNISDTDLTPGVYVYRLIQRDLDGSTKNCGERVFKIESQTSVAEDLRIESVSPQPIREAASIAIYQPAAGRVRVELFSLTGNLVATIRDEFRENGRYRFTWNKSSSAKSSSDHNPIDLSAGLYLIRVSCNAESVAKVVVVE